MNPRDSRFDRLDQIASAQAGLITAAQLAELGIPSATVHRRLRPGGMWSRVLPGVHLITGGRPDRLQREMAALLYGGPGSMLTGVTALVRWDSRLVGTRWVPDDNLVVERVHLLIPHERRRLTVGFVDVERTQNIPEPVTMGGLRLAPIPRAVCDAARRMTAKGDVSALVVAAVRAGLTDPHELRAELDTCQRRGSKFLREAIEHVSAGVWSGWEGELREILSGTRLPEPMWNPRLLGPDGSYIATPDAWLDDVGLAFEVDSREHHTVGEDWQNTLARMARYSAAGVLCVPFTPAQIRDQPTTVANLATEAYESARARVRPDVRAVATVVRGDGTRVRVPSGG